MASIEIEGARIACTQTGAGESVLLLHSSASSSAQWRSLAESLQDSHRVVAPDFFGYGETDPWPGRGPFSLAEEAALADSVVPAGAGRIHVIGHSYGAAVALRYALDRPGRLRSLTLIEPVAFHLIRNAQAGSPDARLFQEVAALAALVWKAATRGDYAGAMARFVDYWNGEGAWSKLEPGAQAVLSRRVPKLSLDFWAALMETADPGGYARISAPCLILRGSHSPQPVKRIAELVCDLLPAARLETINGAGHMLPLTHKAAVSAAVLAQLARQTAGRRRRLVA